MPKPKFVKPLLIGVACTIPVGLVVGLSVNWDHTAFISAVGSSGVKPFIESFGKSYHKSYKNIDVTVESGGTAFAIEQIAQRYTDIGNASNNPYYTIHNNDFLSKWNNKKTLTLGWEGLCLLYSLPKNLSQDAKDNFNVVITEDNILMLWGIFSGWHELVGAQWDPIYETLWFYGDSNKESLSKADQDLLKSTKILPFLRAGGNTGANSSIAFTYYSNLRNFEEMTDNQQKAFSGGQYGDDNEFVETDESNSRAWQSFVAKDKPGSMVYLTTSFLANDNNRLKIKERGYKLAGYLPKQYSNIDNPQPVFIDDIESLKQIATIDGYNWYRPINIMIDLEEEKVKQFVYWIYFGTKEDITFKETDTPFCQEYIDVVYHHGAKPLGDLQFRSMLNEEAISPTAKYWDLLFGDKTTDLDLEQERQSSEYFKTVYGATDTWLDD